MDDNTTITTDSQVDEEVNPQVGEEEVVDDAEVLTDDSSQEGDENVDAKDESSDESQDDDDEDEATKEAMAAMKKLRSENKNLRTRLKAAEAEVQALKESTDSNAIAAERDALKTELESLRTEIRIEKINGVVMTEAEKQGAIEPSVVAKLIDSTKVTFDDEGQPTNIKELVTKTRNEYKRLFAGVVGSANIGNRDERGSDQEGLTPKEMIQSELKRRKNEV